MYTFFKISKAIGGWKKNFFFTFHFLIFEAGNKFGHRGSWLYHLITFSIRTDKDIHGKLIDRRPPLCGEFTNNQNITANIRPWFKGFWRNIIGQFVIKTGLTHLYNKRNWKALFSIQSKKAKYFKIKQKFCMV